jgi:hypothetical protein
VHEQADERAGDGFLKQARHEQEVIVVHPDEIARFVDLGDARSIGRVGFEVRWVVRVGGSVLGRDVLPEEIVEERPKDCNVNDVSMEGDKKEKRGGGEEERLSRMPPHVCGQREL